MCRGRHRVENRVGVVRTSLINVASLSPIAVGACPLFFVPPLEGGLRFRLQVSGFRFQTRVYAISGPHMDPPTAMGLSKATSISEERTTPTRFFQAGVAHDT